MASDFRHQPVLLEESIAHLNLQPGSIIVDGTVGGGGHAERIAAAIGNTGTLVGLDRDPAALEASGLRLREVPASVHLIHESFRRLDEALASVGIAEVDAVLLDLGVSSPQLDRPERGFRFAEAEHSPAPLDMRMDTRQETTAAELLAEASVEQLEQWFREYGELRGAHKLAVAISVARRHAPVATTADLLRVVASARVGGGRKHNPATLVFQALRIAVNDELGALRDGLDAAVRALRPGGRLVVIAYHSLEDRIVKHTFRAASGGANRPGSPVGERLPVTLKLITRRAVRPGSDEIVQNPRSRSARLRTAERIEAAV